MTKALSRNQLIGCGFASRASRGLRPRSLGRRTVGYGDPWKSLMTLGNPRRGTKDSVGRSGRARDLLRAAGPRSTTYYGTVPKLLALATFGFAWLLWVGVGDVVSASPAATNDRPPADLLAGTASRGPELDAVFAHFSVDRLACKFREQKHIALLAKPLQSAGIIYFDRKRGVARKTLTPAAAEVVITATTLRTRSGGRTETISLEKSKQLKVFALIFPTLLRGDRGELDRSFQMGLYGKEQGWWALAFTPREPALKTVVDKVLVFGRGSDVVLLQVNEASGDRTETALSDIVKNGEVPDAAIAAAFEGL